MSDKQPQMDLFQGLIVSLAAGVMQHLGKTLKSAIANAENNADLSADKLWVTKAVVENGPTLRRFWPRARGSASPIRKKTSHIFITLSDTKPARKK